MGYSRIERWIDWQAEKHGVPYVKVDPNGTSSGCPKCEYKRLEEVGYRRFRCPRCGFEADRDVIGKLNVRKKRIKKTRHNPSWGSSDPPHCPSVDRCSPD